MNFNTNTPELSDLKKIYDENGYNHIPELFSKSDMELINNEFDRYIKDCVPKMKEGEVYYVDKENKDTLMQMLKLEEYDAFFHDLFHNSKIKELAANALGEDVIPRAMEYFNKPPGKSNPTPPHQDGYYFNLDNLRSNNNIIISLSEEGKQFNSVELCSLLLNFKNKKINFLIGDTNGISSDIKKNSDLILSLSPLTFPHELARLILIEQIYRAVSISNNSPLPSLLKRFDLI